MSFPGRTFRSHSDTEVLLKYFARFGTPAIEKLNGIFAFAVLDRETGTLTVARVPFGVKPLYYFEDERRLFFRFRDSRVAQSQE